MTIYDDCSSEECLVEVYVKKRFHDPGRFMETVNFVFVLSLDIHSLGFF